MFELGIYCRFLDFFRFFLVLFFSKTKSDIRLDYKIFPTTSIPSLDLIILISLSKYFHNHLLNLISKYLGNHIELKYVDYT
jgi:hypothetical protein